MGSTINKTRARLVRADRSPLRVLLVRITMMVLLVSTVMLIFWIDRDGLRDHHDNVISFSDIAYFTAITITTVGYGDIVPISERARLIDAFLVTPLRLGIWLIFLGTAYELVLQRWIEAVRMKRLQNTLNQHLIICGFGHTGQSAAREAVARGTPAALVLVIDKSPEYLAQATAEGYVGLIGDATKEQILVDAGISRALALIVCLGRDDASVLTVLTARHLNTVVRIVSSVSEEENIKLIMQAGADAIVSPSVVSGHLMANSVKSSHIADYVNDLMRVEGQVRLIERTAKTQEVGKPMRELQGGLVVRLHRGDQRIGFWEGDKTVVQPGDVLLEIVPNGIES